MLYSNTPLGAVGISDDYFSALVSNAVADCYGVAGLAKTDTFDGVRQIFPRNAPKRGVRTQVVNGKLVISLHIKVTYGVNIATIVQNICDKVKYAVESGTQLEVQRIDVYVDDIVV
ncbi:Asp23/Gls24 family envelope stress response protein [Ruminococcaceae bacterium OttesenSCG-928-N02]|nr:Asp23/Gls24 family envelope stress response protein [Ruminococcaceae bacterium OttesenSCG-928-N02]